ncbi:hypothetical protein DFH11DRAFT_1582686 [Phellopilus nigrolimitatus]|nr:hypothetical protein DFH11DRAFT_1582686 [Phellopilus nigrolimitatus]
MIAAVAGIGEFAIRCGGPPVMSRLSGASAMSQCYDHECGIFCVECDPVAARRAWHMHTKIRSTGRRHRARSYCSGARTRCPPLVECELRCDIDTWATSLDS